MKKTIFLVFIFLLTAGGLYFFKFNGDAPSKEILSTAEKITQQTITENQVEHPVKISIPSIYVDADVEYVGLDEKRNMDVPKKAENVAWYNLGPKPGERGSAVIAGHLDDPAGNPAVFWDIKKLTPGEEIEVTDENGEIYKFTIKAIENYPWNEFPLNEVFADSSGKKLNLITCGGTFDKETKNYSERTVVYAQLKE